MVVYIAVDDENGLMFNHRRQSQDRVLRSDILSSCDGEKLWMNNYSRALFGTGTEDASASDQHFIVDDEFLNHAGPDDHCYVETDGLAMYEAKITKLVLYRWNRLYAADLYFEIDLSNWMMISTKDFVGSSHDKITREEWVRNV